MKKKIVFYYHGLSIGGVEKELLSYIRMLKKNKFEIYVFLTQAQGELLSSLPNFVTLRTIGGDSTTPNLKHLANLCIQLFLIQPDIVIGFMQDISINLLLLKVLTHMNFRLIISEQVVLSEWQKVKKTNRFKKHLIKFLYPKANAFISQAESISKDLIDNFSIKQESIFLMPSVIDTHKDTRRHISHYKTLPKQYFLYVGRLAPEKNIELLLLAFNRAVSRLDTVQLLFIGPIDNYILDFATSLGLSKKVRFLGYKQYPEYYYKHAIALVIPSRVEGRCRVMIEAMYFGCPVIASNFAGHNFYIHHKKTGLVFKNNSIISLSQALNYAYGNRIALRNIKQKALRFITKSHLNKINSTLKSEFNNFLLTTH